MSKPKQNWLTRRTSSSALLRICLLLVCIVIFNSGCLVITRQSLSKPVAEAASVQLLPANAFPWRAFHQQIKSNDFDLDVSVLNGVALRETDFLFDIFPLPEFSYHRAETGNVLTVQIQIEPKAGSLAFDPARTFYFGTNASPLVPARIWRGFTDEDSGTRLSTTVSQALPVTTKTWFLLEYEVNGDPEIPFALSLDGCIAEGKAVIIPRLQFQPAHISQRKFRAPM